MNKQELINESIKQDAQDASERACNALESDTKKYRLLGLISLKQLAMVLDEALGEGETEALINRLSERLKGRAK